MDNKQIVILGAARTPIGNFLGSLRESSAVQLGATAIRAALERSEVSAQKISEVIMGCVLPAGLGQAPARQAAMLAGIPTSTGAVTINKVCGSGLKAVMLAHDLIQTGTDEIDIAGGMESMSNAPYLLPKARKGYRLGHQQVLDHMFYDGLEDAHDKGKLMGNFAEQCAKQFNFSREQQDDFALTSLQRAKNATEEGIFRQEIVPVHTQTSQGELVIHDDEGPLSAKAEKIPTLKPAFSPDGTITAANSSSISDGAAAVVLTSETLARQNKWPIIAKIIAHSTYSDDPDKFPTAPIGAIKKVLQKANWKIEEVDLFEINEAFAVVVMAAMQALNISHKKVNIHGGATILGHPIGASGARLLVTLIYALKHHQLKRGIVSLCLGGGEAVAMAIEV